MIARSGAVKRGGSVKHPCPASTAVSCVSQLIYHKKWLEDFESMKKRSKKQKKMKT
jgi:hypothetical protein